MVQAAIAAVSTLKLSEGTLQHKMQETQTVSTATITVGERTTGKEHLPVAHVPATTEQPPLYQGLLNAEVHYATKTDDEDPLYPPGFGPVAKLAEVGVNASPTLLEVAQGE
ncbi:hypothetical protein ZWY2020_047057 [Hordeum vulgare]|nr:hypothetical protein ZWY2020_047057 [Hordeum vulgare]